MPDIPIPATCRLCGDHPDQTWCTPCTAEVFAEGGEAPEPRAYDEQLEAESSEAFGEILRLRETLRAALRAAAALTDEQVHELTAHGHGAEYTRGWDAAGFAVTRAIEDAGGV